MFCEKCGTKLPDTAKFCTNCGYKIIEEKEDTSSQEKIKDDVPLLTVQPKFDFGYVVLPSLLTLPFFLLILIPFAYIIGGLLGPQMPIIIGVIVIAIVLISYMIEILIQKKQYSSYKYEFYKTKVIYKDSFMDISEKEIKYKNIREITMRQTFTQRAFDLGTIVLYTSAETGYYNGISISYIKDVKKIYEEIKEIIGL